MGPPRPRICCICRYKTRGKESKAELRSKWRTSNKYEKDFEVCFGAAAEGRSGDLCLSCVNIVGVRFKNNPTTCFSDRLDKYLRKDSDNVATGHDHLYNSFMSPVTTIPKSSSVLTNITNDDVSFIHDSTCSTQSPSTSNATNVHVRRLSPRKRNRSVSETENLPDRVSRARPDHHGHVENNVAKPGVEEISTISKEALIVQHKTEIKNLQNKLEAEKQRFDSFLNVSSEGPLTNSQKKMLNLLITNRENNKDEDGCIVVPQSGSGGKPRRYKRVPKIQVSSKNAAKRTLNQRSQCHEQFEKIVSTPSTLSKSATIPDGVHQQRVNNIKRDRINYAAAAEEAGLKIVTRFNKETVLSLRSVMTLRMWRLLKRVFHNETGWDVFGSVDKMKKEVEKVEFNYECGTLKSTTGEMLHFVRVTDVKEVISQIVSQLNQANQLICLQNIPEDCLWLHLSADKGGKTTKLILQIINQKERHSIHSAKLIGYFEGKDNRVNLETVFGPILQDIEECAKDIPGLNLQRPDVQIHPVPSCQHPDLCDGSVRWTPLMPFDCTNTTVSVDCKACKKSCRCSNDLLTPAMPTDSQTVLPDTDFTQSAPLPHSKPSHDSPTTSMSLPLPTPTAPSTSANIPTPITPSTSADVPTPTTPSTSANVPTPTTCTHASPSQDAPLDHADLTSTPFLQPKSNLDFTTPFRSGTDTDSNLRRNLFTGSSHSQVAPIYRTCRITLGGDWEGLAKFVGLSGPNGLYFCNHCLVKLSETSQGVPHAINILPKYQHYTRGNDVSVPADDTFLRTFKHCETMHKAYKEKVEVSGKAEAKQFQNCINKPLINGGYVIDSISTTPLHISLGLGLHFLNVIEKEAIELDRQIKEKEGQYDGFQSVFERKREILASCQTVRTKIAKTEEKINHVIERKKELILDRGQFFKRDKNGRYCNKSDLAVGVRERFDKIVEEKDSLVKEKEKQEKQLQKIEGTLSKVLDELMQTRGPFKARLDNLLDEMQLKRAAYHSGALIGPDVKKLVTSSNIKKFSKAFKPIRLIKANSSDETVYTFGSMRVQVKIVTLLNKFKQCYDLYTANRPLCRHETELLSLRCASLGCWFPVNFPNENLKRKFHLLTVDVPKQARRLGTIGMITEQTIESIHPYINELDRRFAKVADKTQKGLIICKQQNLFSQPAWTAVKKPKKVQR